ncbi:MAG: hypothetical protein O2819_00490 [Planctomycetota bacterium]|nr:hypothetical protein [Planctomycetota bacterium]MDA1105425.1 hypothetical protein [Planctomycetota bacterium]
MATLRCTIVSPDAELFSDAVNYASFQAWDGQRGVIAGTSPFLAKLIPGVTRIDTVSGSRFFAIDGGFAQMQGDELTLLVDKATAAEDISLTEAQAALVVANAKVTAPTDRASTLTEREAIEAAQQIARTRVALSSKGK